MAPTLYMSEISPSCRAVLMTARILGLTLKVKKIDLSKNEQLTPHFLKVRIFSKTVSVNLMHRRCSQHLTALYQRMILPNILNITTNEIL